MQKSPIQANKDTRLGHTKDTKLICSNRAFWSFPRSAPIRDLAPLLSPYSPGFGYNTDMLRSHLDHTSECIAVLQFSGPEHCS